MAYATQSRTSEFEETLTSSIRLSIVLLTWNSEKYIQRCIESLKSSLSNFVYKWEAIIVDNGSLDNTVPIVKKLFQENPDQLHIHLLSVNHGTTVSRNIALKKAKGTFVAIIDSDIEVTGNVFTLLIDVLENDFSIGLVAPQILYPDGKWQKSYDRFPTIFQKINRFFRLKAVENRQQTLKITEIRKKVDYAISAFWLFRRTLLNTVGLLDEKIFYSPEDVDYCLRIWKAGYSVVYFPDCSVVHYTQEISRGWKINKSKFHHLAGLMYFFLKHRYFFTPPLLSK